MGNGKLLIFLLDATLVVECVALPYNTRIFATSKSKCSIYNNEQLHVIMDRVCEICHEMYSYRYPNTRADCRFEMQKFFHFYSKM